MVIFISHIHEDRDLAIQLKNDIESAFSDDTIVFVSSHKNDVRLGDEWFKEIEKALEESQIVILLLSPEAVVRPWVNFEAGAAWFTKKKPIPVCCKGQSLSQLPPPFSLRQGIELNNREAGTMLLQVLAEKLGLQHKAIDVDSLITLATESSKDSALSENPIQSADLSLPESLIARVSGENFVAIRFSETFPGVRGSQLFEDPDTIIHRLSILLAEPLTHTNERSGTTNTPFWWFRGSSNLDIDKFSVISSSKVLMDIYELVPRKAIVYRNSGRPEREFLYLETSADQPSGLYQYNSPLNELALKNGEVGYGNFLFEEFGVWNEHLISRNEYDDGAAMINGTPTRTPGAMLRARYITPYNLVICAQRSVFNNNVIEDDAERILDGMLIGRNTIDNLIQLAMSAPRPHWFDR